jgi:type II secretion system protein H
MALKKYLGGSVVNHLLRSQLLKHLASHHERNRTKASGFTLIELLVVLVIIGVLAAIVGPSWVAFTNRQKINSATNRVFTALKSAQSQAKKENRPKTVTIDKVNRTITTPNAAQESLDSNVQIVDVTENNPANSIVSSNIATILFDEKGTPFKLDTSITPNPRIKAVIPIQIKLKHDLIGQEQCVTIRTLLGSVDTNCAL